MSLCVILYIRGGTWEEKSHTIDEDNTDLESKAVRRQNSSKKTARVELRVLGIKMNF